MNFVNIFMGQEVIFLWRHNDQGMNFFLTVELLQTQKH